MNPGAQTVRCAAILAGGHSSRMGREKALLGFDGQPLIARIADVLRPLFPQIVVVTVKSEVAAAAQLPAISDSVPGRGPLGGIHIALEHFGAPVFVVACDMPRLNADFIRFLGEDFDENARVPLSDEGFEPLHAVYAPACLPTFERALQSEGKMPSMRALLREVGAQWVPVDVARRFDVDLTMFSNWNAPDDVEL